MKTTKVSKILVALDYDQSAIKVAKAAYALANSMNAEIYLLHVITDPVYYSTLAYSPIMGLMGEMDASSEQFADAEGLKSVTQKFLDNLKHHFGDDSINTIVGEGEIASTIIKIAEKYHIGVIAMGTHSTKWLENIVMGSVASDVLRKSSVPLFIVPTKKHK